MSIDNNITIAKIKKALPLRTIAIILLVVLVLSTVFYVTVQNRNKDEILIWHITTDSTNYFSEDVLKTINDYGKKNGFDRILLTKRHPDDKYFDVFMSTTMYYTSDIFIMREDVVRKYADMDMFLPLSFDVKETEKLIYINSDAVGVLLYEDYYLLINAKTKVDLKVLCDILEILIEN